MSYTSLNFSGIAGSYISVPSTNLSFGTGNFTIEWWQYETDSNPYPRPFSIGSFVSGIEIAVSIESGIFYFWSNSSPVYSYTLPTYKNTWVHFAIVRQSDSITIYLNGNPLDGSPFSYLDTYSFTENLIIGNETNLTGEPEYTETAFGGQIYNFEWLVGTAKYSAPFTPSTNVPSDPGSYALILNGNYSGGTESGSVTNFDVGQSSNIPGVIPPPPPPPVPPAPITGLNFNPLNKRFGSISFGSFWYGNSTNFPGFLYKKNVGVGGRRSTKMAPGGNVTCNSSTYLYNKYKPGGGGVGASSIANRRAKNRLATVCNGQKCFPCYPSLGQYNKSYNTKGFIPCPVRLPVPSGSYLYSKNNTTDDGFPVGEPVEKDMGDQEYTEILNPQDYPDYFPGMAPFTDENIVAGDKSDDDRLIASYWENWDDDIFDNWGYFYLYDVEQGKYYFPLITPQNENDGEIFTQTFNAFGRTFTIKQGYPVQGIFKFDISVNDNKPFKFGGYGNMGSDEDEVNTFLTYPYSIGSTNLTLYYVKQEEDGDTEEIIYTYCVPKKVSENSIQTYDLYQEPGNDDTSWMSKTVTNGLIVYFSKTNDVKEWVVNDLGIQG